ncbi:MAG: hypothetical protein ACK5NG_06795 [Chthoniobacterales bacterium]
MSVQLINCSRATQGHDYTKLQQGIKKLGSWWHCIEAIWIVDTKFSTADIRDALKPHIGAKDQIFVAQLQGNWATSGLNEKCNQWLTENLAE